jgi:hypothetical protein
MNTIYYIHCWKLYENDFTMPDTFEGDLVSLFCER